MWILKCPDKSFSVKLYNLNVWGRKATGKLSAIVHWLRSFTLTVLVIWLAWVYNTVLCVRSIWHHFTEEVRACYFNCSLVLLRFFLCDKIHQSTCCLRLLSTPRWWFCCCYLIIVCCTFVVCEWCCVVVLWFSSMCPFYFAITSVRKRKTLVIIKYEPRHDISNNMLCVTSKGSDQPAQTRSLIRAFASRLNIQWLLSYRPNIILSL